MPLGFDYLIQVEASEALLVEQGRLLPAGCEGAGQASIAALRVPRDSGNYLDMVGNVLFIYYYNLDRAVRHCGPPVQRNGVISHTAGLGLHDGVAVRDAQIELVTCQGQNTSSSQLTYGLVIQRMPAGLLDRPRPHDIRPLTT